jgi:CheY-like chemotaxis protein
MSGSLNAKDGGGADFLAGGGVMGRIMRAHDWSSTPLGAPATWPQALRTAVRLLLNTGHPMYIWWGPDLLCLHNDAYSRSIGPDRHPSSLGKPGREVWAEIWPIIGLMVDQVMSSGEATWRENDLVPITRFGRRGAAGIKVLQSGARVELLITDVGLPNGMNGRQVADAAQSLHPGLKVLFITGYAENAAVGNGHLEPGMELLTKPFTMEAIVSKVSAMLKS